MAHPLRPVVLVRPAFGVKMMAWKPPATQHKELLLAKYFEVESPGLCQEGMSCFLKKATKQVMCQIKTQQLLLAAPAVAVVANHLQTDIYTMFPKCILESLSSSSLHIACFALHLLPHGDTTFSFSDVLSWAATATGGDSWR